MDVKKVGCLWCKKATERDNQVCSVGCFHDLHHAEQLLRSLESDLKHLKEQFRRLTQHLNNFSEFVEESRIAHRTANGSRVPKKLDEDAVGLARKIKQMEEDIKSICEALS
jgi:hypothetical protein